MDNPKGERDWTFLSRGSSEWNKGKVLRKNRKCIKGKTRSKKKGSRTTRTIITYVREKKGDASQPGVPQETRIHHIN